MPHHHYGPAYPVLEASDAQQQRNQFWHECQTLFHLKRQSHILLAVARLQVCLHFDRGGNPLTFVDDTGPRTFENFKQFSDALGGGSGEKDHSRESLQVDLFCYLVCVHLSSSDSDSQPTSLSKDAICLLPKRFWRALLARVARGSLDRPRLIQPIAQLHEWFLKQDALHKEVRFVLLVMKHLKATGTPMNAQAACEAICDLLYTTTGGSNYNTWIEGDTIALESVKECVRLVLNPKGDAAAAETTHAPRAPESSSRTTNTTRKRPASTSREPPPPARQKQVASTAAPSMRQKQLAPEQPPPNPEASKDVASVLQQLFEQCAAPSVAMPTAAEFLAELGPQASSDPPHSEPRLLAFCYYFALRARSSDTPSSPSLEACGRLAHEMVRYLHRLQDPHRPLSQASQAAPPLPPLPFEDEHPHMSVNPALLINH